MFRESRIQLILEINEHFFILKYISQTKINHQKKLIIESKNNRRGMSKIYFRFRFGPVALGALGDGDPR